MPDKDIPPKIREEILEHLAAAEYALFYVRYLLNKVKQTKIKKIKKPS